MGGSHHPDRGETRPALKTRLIGDAAVYKSLLDRTELRKQEGVDYFKNTLRPNFIKGAQSVFMWRFMSFTQNRRRENDFVRWTGRFSIAIKRIKESWIDLLDPGMTITSQVYLDDIAQQSQEATQQHAAAVQAAQVNGTPVPPVPVAMNPATQAVFELWKTKEKPTTCSSFR